VAALAVALVGTLLGGAPASAYPGAPWFEPSKPYTANFPDPDVLRVGDTYYAYATPTGGAYLPVMTSTDLQTWTARPKYDPGAPLNRDPYFNDALPYPARWGGDYGGGRMTKEIWAPGVERFGDAYIAFYSVRMPNSNRFCLSTARATSPLGPFVDNSPGPLHCDSDPNGSIDPEPFRDPATGRAYLIWKSEGVPGSAPTKLWSRELGPDGWTFASGSSQRELLRTSQGWEGSVIESPSMVRHDGQTYLFYSANEWDSDRYATGYALCDGPLGPCYKPRTTPLLASYGDRLGPGAPSAFVDSANQLRVAHHYWNAPYTSYPAYPACTSNRSCTTQGQRRMTNVKISGAGGGLAWAGEGPLATSAPPPPPPYSGPVPTVVAPDRGVPGGPGARGRLHRRAELVGPRADGRLRRVVAGGLRDVGPLLARGRGQPRADGLVPRPGDPGERRLAAHADDRPVPRRQQLAARGQHRATGRRRDRLGDLEGPLLAARPGHP
jgi:hypothetical protein